MATPGLRRSFLLFHITLGLVLLVFSARTALEALGISSAFTDPHVAIIAIVELVGAVLFLFGRTLRIGAVLLLLSIGIATLHHALAGDFRGDLLVYATATWFVMVHGPAWPRGKMPDHAAA